jgi:hypothetical protein
MSTDTRRCTRIFLDLSPFDTKSALKNPFFCLVIYLRFATSGASVLDKGGKQFRFGMRLI